MTRRSLLLYLFIGTLLASCAPSGAGQGTPDIQGTINANAQTLVAAIFQTQTALAPAATNTALPTATALPTSTALTTLLSSPTTFVQQPVLIAASATPTGPTPTPIPSSLGVGCKNLRLINSYTIPDSPLRPGQDFTQNWQVENNGTCDWLYQFAYVYASGDKFGSTTSVKLSNKFVPGKWTTFSINMTAPNNSGTYKASWRLTDGDSPFGAVLTMSVTVGGSTKTPKATPNLQQTADALDTAIAVQVKAVTKTAKAVCATLEAQGDVCPQP